MASTHVQTATDTTTDIVFPVVTEPMSTELVVPPAPQGKMANGLMQVVKAQPSVVTTGTLDCLALCRGNLLEEVHRTADELYPKMVGSAGQPGNTALVMTYGTGALEGVNRVIDDILAGTDDVKIPELKALMKELNSNMREIQRKWDVSDPKVVKRLQNWGKGVGSWFKAGVSMLDALRDDLTDINTQLDRTAAKLASGGDVVLRNILWNDRLYGKNEEEIVQVIKVLAVMQLLRNRAVEEANAVQVTDEFGDRGAEDKARLVAFAQTMDQKISSYKGRLFIAWATSPNLRQMRMVSEGVLTKVYDTIYTTIPTMKATLAQWRMLASTMDASAFADEVNESMNKWIAAFDAASTAGVQQMAASNAKTALAPATVALMAKGVADRAEIIIAAMEEGFENRAELDAAIREAKTVLNAADQRVTTEFVERYIGLATGSGVNDVARSTSTPIAAS